MSKLTRWKRPQLTLALLSLMVVACGGSQLAAGSTQPLSAPPVGTIAPTPAPSATATPAPSPSSTARSLPSPTSAATLTPTPTATPSVAPTASPTPVPTQAPAASPAPTPTPTPTLEPTASPEPTAKVTRTAIRLIKWKDYQVIQTVKNTGDTWVALSSSSSDYTVFAADGSVTDTGTADSAAPKYLAPGQIGYVVAESLGQDLKLGELASAEMEVLFDPVDEPGPTFPTSKVKRQPASFGGTGVSGLIKNDSDKDLSFLTVVAIAFDTNDRPVGYATDILEHVGVGATKAFKTEELPSTVRAVGRLRVFADPLT